MQSGLTSADQALGTIAGGSTSMKQYLTELQHSYLGKKFYIPNETLKSKTFKPALSTYMSDGNKITKLTVVLKGDPSADADDHDGGGSFKVTICQVLKIRCL